MTQPRLCEEAILAEAAAHVPEKGLLLSYFIGNGEDGLHLAHSDDALHFRPIDDGRPLLAPTLGNECLMRDPHICVGPDETFHLVWTIGWGACAIGYAHSKDLRHWSPQRAIDVMGHEPDACNAWAPETVYDPSTGRFVIVWASTVRGRFEETVAANLPEKNHRQYVTTTRDFEYCTPTRLLYDPGFSVIDATLAPLPRDEADTANDRSACRWLMCCKDETYEPAAKSLHLASSDTVDAGYGPAGPAIYDAAWAEGPSIVRLGRLWLIYFDKYKIGQYGAVASFDLQTWCDVSHLLQMPPGARHASAVVAPGRVIQSLLDH